MKSFTHNYKGYGIHPSSCMVHVVKEGDIHHILFEEREEDVGTSVTNASEQIATEIVSLLDLDHTKCRFYETYHYDDRIDEISYTWNEGEARNPTWSHGVKEDIVKLFKDVLEWDR